MEISNYKFMHGGVQFKFPSDTPLPHTHTSEFIFAIALIVPNVSENTKSTNNIVQWNIKLSSLQMITVRQNWLHAYLTLEIDQNTNTQLGPLYMQYHDNMISFSIDCLTKASVKLHMYCQFSVRIARDQRPMSQ